MNEKESTRSSFMSKEEERACAALYEGLAERMIFLGDPDLRRQTTADIGSINTAAHLVHLAEGEYGIRDPRFTEVLTSAFGACQALMTGDQDHALLAKVGAIITYADLAQHYHRWPPDAMGMFASVFAKNQKPPGSNIVMGGALYAKLAEYHLQDGSGTSDFFDTLDRSLLGSVATKQDYVNKIGLHAAAATIARMIKMNEMQMRLPWVRVTEGAGGDMEWVNPGGGYPDSIMLLGLGCLVSDRKLREAVRLGVPTHSGYLEQRLPRILAGIKAPLETIPESQLRNLADHKQFLHVSIRALRRPKGLSAPIAFGRETAWKREEVMAYASFDALSFIVGMRLAHELRKKFEDIEAREYQRLGGGHARKRKEDAKRKALEAAMDRWMTRLTQNHDTIHEGPQSILGVALRESQIIDGEKFWGHEEAQAHIRSTVQALALQNRTGILLVRDEPAIIDMYRTHIWRYELTLRDKFELARALLADTKSLLWKDIPQAFQAEVVQAVENGATVTPACMENVIEWLAIEERFVLRCETIRDEYLPKGLIP